MRWRSPAEQRALTRRRQLIGAALLAGYLALWFVDKPIFVNFQYQTGAGHGDLGQMFKAFGSLPFWILACLAIALAAPRRDRRRQWALLVFLSATASGLIAEILKRIIGRERPWTGDALGGLDPAAAAEQGARVLEIGDKVHKPFLHAFWDTTNLGFPSSHAAVAFGATLMAMRFWPGAWPVLLIAGLGCAWQRLITGAHFVTDVYGALAIAWIVSAWIDGRVRGDWR
ncbi:MAG: phosphatase PAP2 family protein [Phycisphaerales bacterium JB039]